MASADPRDPAYGAPFVPAADVQTITVTGAPTGGTYTLGLTGSGSDSGALANNASAATIQTALRTLTGDTGLAVTGTGPFTVTSAKYGAQPALTLKTNSLTGGTTPNVELTHTTGTPSVGSTSRAGSRTVYDMYRKVNLRITATDNDDHYTTNGDLYHE